MEKKNSWVFFAAGSNPAFSFIKISAIIFCLKNTQVCADFYKCIFYDNFIDAVSVLKSNFKDEINIVEKIFDKFFGDWV